MNRQRLQVGLAAVAAVALMFLAGCGDDDDATEETVDTTDTPAETTTGTEGEVTIEVLEEVDPGGDGPFTATGAAVDDGTVCAAGDAMITGIVDADTGQPPPWTPEPENLIVDWEFSCEDGSGTFVLQLAQPAYDQETQLPEWSESGEVVDSGSTWEALSGTGAYETLAGSGTLTFQVLDPSGRPIQQTWVGSLETTS